MGVEDVVEDLHAEMGCADFVQIRKGQRKAQLRPAKIFFNSINFRAQITTRFFDKRQYIVKGVIGHRFSFYLSATDQVSSLRCVVAVLILLA